MTPDQREKVLPALWGHHPKPSDSTLLSELPNLYQSFQATVLIKKSPEQREKWRRLRHLAVTTFINVIGNDKKLVNLTSDDVDKLRGHWKNSILAGEVAMALRGLGQPQGNDHEYRQVYCRTAHAVRIGVQHPCISQ